LPTLVRHGFDDNHVMLDGRRRGYETRRDLIDVLHPSAERELNWTLNERERIARAARGLVEALRELASHEAVLFPEIVARLEPTVLGQLTEQLCQFDEQTASRWPGIDIAACTARCSHATPRLCHQHRKSCSERRHVTAASTMIASIAPVLPRFGTGQIRFAIA
jgi:hypothetical protein